MTDGEFFINNFPVWRAGWGRQFSGKEKMMENISWWVIELMVMGMIISYWLGRKNQESNYNKLKEHSDALQRVVDNKPIQYYNYTIYFSYRHYSGQMFSKTHTKYDTVTMTLPYEIEVVGTAHQPLLAYINSVARKDNSRIIRFEKNK